MRFVCDSCRAQYMISDDKVGAKGVKIKCKKCGHMILVRPAGAAASKDNGAPEAPAMESTAAAAPSHGGTGSSAADMPTSVGTPPAGGIFTGVEEDEIGAVFDQVLNSGSHKIPAGEPVGSEARESRSATSDAVSKLAEAEEQPDEPQAAPPANDWYVAIDERQVGPLSIEKVKEHWDRGEVGPDSLCWRAGFSDWIPLSEATELASVLAPRPARPVIVAPAAVAATAPSAPAPVESAFSAGAAAKSARPEIPAAPALGAEPTSSGWKPSAASVLASLVKEENEALSKPPPKPAPVEEKPAVGGLLDLPPPESAQAPAARVAPMLAAVAAEPAMRPQPAGMPYAPVAPAPAYAQPAPAYAQPAPAYAGYPQPAYPGYPPPSAPGQQGGNNKLIMVAGIGAAAAVLLALVLVFALRDSSSPPDDEAVAVVTPAGTEKAAEVPPTTPGPNAAQAQPAANPGVNPSQPTPGTAPTAAPAGAAAPGSTPGAQPAVATPTQPAAPPPAPVDPGTTKPPPAGRTEAPTLAKVDREPPRTSPRRTETAPAPRVKPQEEEISDDEFDKLFDTKKPAAKADRQPKAPGVYVPPAPGGDSRGSLPERLMESDIMAVVLANKPAIVKCVNDAKRKDPGVGGKLVMRWTIQPSGRTTGVSVRTDEFRRTYMATCMTNLIKGWSFPRHRKQGSPIDFPFTF